MAKSFLFAAVAALGVSLSSPALAQTCPSTSLTNGTTADATQVMAWINCRAPIASPSLTGTASILVPNIPVSDALFITTPSTGLQTDIVFEQASTYIWQMGFDASSTFFLYDDATARIDLQIVSGGNMGLMPSGGKVGIGTGTPRQQ